jgi:cation diffusion facilitator family transporter
MHNPRAVRRVVMAIFAMNLAVAAAKGAYGWVSGSLAVASDAVHSLLDAASYIVAFVVLRAAEAPPDEDHPYGHRKIEIVAATFVGILIAAGSLRFGLDAIHALVHGHAPARVGVAGLVVEGATLAVNVFVARYEAIRAKQLNSAFLTADAAHTGSDVWVTIGVMAGLGATILGFHRADAIVALVVLLVIARAAWSILAENVSVLVDRVVIDARRIREVAKAVAGVAGVHRIRSRGLTGAVHLDFHLQVDGALPLRRAHEISHAVETAVRGSFPDVVDVTIHVEPEDEPEEEL